MDKKLIYIAPFRTKFPSNASSLHMIKMCEAFSKLNYKVILLVGNNEASEKEILEYFDIKVPFKIVKLNSFNSRLGNIGYACKTAWYVKNSKPSYVIGRSVTALSLLAILRTYVTIDMHAPIWEAHKVDKILFSIASKLRYMKKITVNSRALRNMMTEAKCVVANKLFVAHNGSDEFEEFDFSSYTDELLLQTPQITLNVGYFGSLYAGRGIELILDLAQVSSDCLFHVFGGTDEDVKRWSKATNAKNILFYGHISYKDTFYYRNKCDVLIAPYNPKGVTVSSDNKGDSSKYMNPIKLIEYISAGKPIITSDMEVLQEILTPKCAFFCDYNNIHSWAKALSELKNKNLRKHMGKEASAIFKQGYTWQSRAQKLL